MNNASNFLSEEKIGSFVSGLAGLSPDELKKAKVLFIRNAITEYNATKETYKKMLYIPVIGWLSYLMNLPFQATVFKGMKQKIFNSIEVWKDDLAGETFNIDGEEIQL